MLFDPSQRRHYIDGISRGKSTTCDDRLLTFGGASGYGLMSGAGVAA
jgi:hypothetical protein